jgi:phospho-N-acetylmuramoyl-pentapeptide-transferase
MGDTGSMALGGILAAGAVLMKLEFVLAIAGLVYVIEALSVIIQVFYFKKTGGKRFFKMAPIHHHFELCGMTEKKVVMMFYAVTTGFCLLAFLVMSI